MLPAPWLLLRRPALRDTTRRRRRGALVPVTAVVGPPLLLRRSLHDTTRHDAANDGRAATHDGRGMSSGAHLPYPVPSSTSHHARVLLLYPFFMQTPSSPCAPLLPSRAPLEICYRFAHCRSLDPSSTVASCLLTLLATAQ
jgi:hypothetical protein